ncbi:MAG: SHOCT domain-containing protein [Lachnospiraceae bacterium]
MGLFGKKEPCCICGSSNASKTISDGTICSECQAKSGLITMNWKSVSSDRVKTAIKATETNKERQAMFKQTKKIEKYLFIDESKNWFQIPAYGSLVFDINDIVNYEVIEDGESLTKGGLGSAIAGGVLFGGVGAVVGGITGGKTTKKVIQELRVKFVTRNPIYPEIYINILTTGKIKSGSILYNAYYGHLQSILTALTLMKNAAQDQETSKISSADEILKYKNLLDQGIITQDEFEAKKKQLLGL